MNKELKPCPFCGDEPKLIINKDLNTTYRIRCKNLNCDARPSTSWFNHIDDAVKHWNTRKPMDKVVKQLRELQNSCRDPLEIRVMDEVIEIVKGDTE